MNVQQIFDLGVKNAIQTDPRGKKGIEKYFKAIKQDYEDLSSSEKQYFDKTKLTNPYPDSMIHVNDERKEVKRVLAGIDIGGSEILLADQLGLHNKKIDLVISHHPNGRSFASLHEVMDM
jgi:hypothetical protein